MDEDLSDGVALVSVAHPRPPWWQRPYWWVRMLFADISEDSIETIPWPPDGAVPYTEDPRPAWPLRAWYWLRNWRARRIAAQYTIAEDEICVCENDELGWPGPPDDTQ